MGRPDEALQEIATATALLPGDTDAPILLVPLLEAAGRKKEAEELFRRTVEARARVLADYPQSAGQHNAIAWLCARCRRQLDKGLEHAEKAVALAPGEPVFLDSLAELHFQRGDRAKAVAVMNHCLALEPNRPYFRRQLQRFKTGDPQSDPPDEHAASGP